MKNEYSKSWNRSKQPRKQRKFLYNAPQHVKSGMLGCHLSKELRGKHSRRAVRLIRGDRVRIMKGTHRKREGKVERVDVKNSRVYITGIETIRKDGNKVLYPFRIPNLLIVELNLSDKKRAEKLRPKVQQNG
ncbi:50S ribosomal protein L24 [Candidatus Woesearchaeota archaeon]|nr:50S ribosomal protein L24 [Candidatus Woesearchaeota archaeon]